MHVSKYVPVSSINYWSMFKIIYNHDFVFQCSTLKVIINNVEPFLREMINIYLKRVEWPKKSFVVGSRPTATTDFTLRLVKHSWLTTSSGRLCACVVLRGRVHAQCTAGAADRKALALFIPYVLLCRTANYRAATAVSCSVRALWNELASSVNEDGCGRRQDVRVRNRQVNRV